MIERTWGPSSEVLKAENLHVSKWVQGQPTNIDQLLGSVVLVEVFQVNCPGCFMYGLPQAIQMYNKYHDKGLAVIGIATAFEDYGKNTLANLNLLMTEGAVVGDTLHRLTELESKMKELVSPARTEHLTDINKHLETNEAFEQVREFVEGTGLLRQEQLEGKNLIEEVKKGVFLRNGKLSYNIPFPVGMDVVDKETESDSAGGHEILTNYYQEGKTFRAYGLEGTPSSILIDRQGLVRSVELGKDESLEKKIKVLLKSKG